MSFDLAFQRTVGIEGGYSNNPADPGGETMWGITVAVARAHGYGAAMKDMPIAAAKDIYRAAYWDLLNLGDLDVVSPPVALEMFDIGVNCGPGVPMRFLQRALNAFNREGKDYSDIPVDGLGGARSVQALRAFIALRGKTGEIVMVAALHAELGVRYFEIVERAPKSEDFLFGWYAKRILV